MAGTSIQDVMMLTPSIELLGLRSAAPGNFSPVETGHGPLLVSVLLEKSNICF
jgi:hypothetical protein